MKSKLIALALVASAALCLSGCLNSTTLASSAVLVQSLANAGCKGTVHIAGSATTAAAGVPSANISNTFDGTCDPSAVGASKGAVAAIPAAP